MRKEEVLEYLHKRIPELGTVTYFGIPLRDFEKDDVIRILVLGDKQLRLASDREAAEEKKVWRS